MLAVIHPRIDPIPRLTLQPLDPVDIDDHGLAAPEIPFLHIHGFHRSQRQVCTVYLPAVSELSRTFSVPHFLYNTTDTKKQPPAP